MLLRIVTFLDWLDIYKKFVKGFASIAKSLYVRKQKILWLEDCEKSFDKLKDHLTQMHVLILPKVGVPYMVYTDTSETSLGCVIIHESCVCIQAVMET